MVHTQSCLCRIVLPIVILESLRVFEKFSDDESKCLGDPCVDPVGLWVEWSLFGLASLEIWALRCCFARLLCVKPPNLVHSLHFIGWSLGVFANLLDCAFRPFLHCFASVLVQEVLLKRRLGVATICWTLSLLRLAPDLIVIFLILFSSVDIAVFSQACNSLW
jgi:hypothetical protein